MSRDEQKRAADSPTLPLGSGAATAPARAPAADPTLVASVSERYNIIRELGRGGMGVVYLAQDRETRDEIALKVLRRELAGDEAILDRFRNELRLARKITHKHVCRTYELLRFGEHTVISMEYVRGESLREVLRRFGALSRPTVLRMAAQVCSALQEAHGQGIVHRDLKPENVVIDLDGNVKVMDFGIARSLRTEESTTGGVMGTPAYMAPEQIDGHPADARTDIYALGLMLHEMLSGQAAFDGDTPMSVAMRHLKEPPPRLREVEPSVPPKIEKTVLRCLEKSPEKRYQSVQELAAALEEKQEVVAVEREQSPELPWQLQRWTRADWLLLGAGVAGLAVFLLLFARALPYQKLALPFSREQAASKARSIVEQITPGTGVTIYKPQYGWFWMDDHVPQDFQGWNGRSWIVEGARPDTNISALGRGWRGQVGVEFNHHGEVESFTSQPAAPEAAAASAPDDFDTIEPSAQRAAEKLFAVQLAEPVRKFRYDANERKWLYTDVRPKLQPWLADIPDRKIPVIPYVWQTHEPGRPARTLTLWATRAGTWAAGSFYEERRYDDNGYESNMRWTSAMHWGAALLALLSVPIMVFFFGKKLYRQTVAMLLVPAGAGATAFFLFLLEVDELPVWRSLVICVVLLLLLYMLLRVAHYYLGKTIPYAYTTLSALLLRPWSEKGTGLALTRGILLAAIFAGMHVLLMLAMIPAGGEVSTTWFTPVLASLFRLGTADPSPAWGFAVTVPAAVIYPGLLGITVALAKRSSSAVWTPVIVAAAVWAATTATLPGASLYPSWALYTTSAAQGALLAWLLLRYDMLTIMSMVMTIETFFLVYPLWRMNLVEDSFAYTFGFAPFGLLLVTAILLTQRSWLRSKWARLRAVVE